METTMSKHQSISVSVSEKKQRARTITTSSFWEKAEFNRYGSIAMILTILGCMGGFAAAFGAGADIFKIALVVFPTVLSLAFILGVMPMRLIVWSSSIAVLIDIILLIVSLA
jgi:hypothetical protein